VSNNIDPELPLDKSSFTYQWYRNCTHRLEDETDFVSSLSSQYIVFNFCIFNQLINPPFIYLLPKKI